MCTCNNLPALALGTMVTIGIGGLNLLMFIAVSPVLEITMIQAAERFFDASATACVCVCVCACVCVRESVESQNMK